MRKIKSRKERIKRYNYFRFVILIFVFFLGISNIRYVEAGMNDSKITKNRINDIYAYAYVNGEDHLYYLNMYRMNGRISYCIEIGVDITTEIYHSTENFSVSYLSNAQIEYIRSISYFGYEYDGHDDYRYYMAAQEIIWEYLSGNKINVEWVNELNVNGTRINIDYYKNRILNLRNEYYNRIAFDWIDGQYYSVGDLIVLTDYAKVLSYYEIESCGYTNSWIDGNKLYIQVSDDYVGLDEINLKRRVYYDYNSLLYYYDNSQKLISNGNFKEIRKNIYFKVKGDRLNGQVVDSKTEQSSPLGQATLEGARYEVYNLKKELIGSYVADVNGKFYIDNLPYGTYYIKQIEASDGYLLNEEEVVFDFSSDSTELKLRQDIISNVVEIRKLYGKSAGKYIPEDNISFLIYDNFDNIYEEIITDNNGEAKVWLPYGNYIFHQNNTTLGYSKVDDFNISVTEYKSENIFYQLVDQLIECRVQLNTLESNKEMAIEMEGFLYKIKKKGENTYLTYEGNDVFSANESGILLFPMLFSYGDYILEQINVPAGIVLNKDVVEFSIGEQTNFEMIDNYLFLNLSFFNSFQLARINILANEEVYYSSFNDYGYTKKIRENSLFSLIANQDIIVNNKILYKAGEIINEVVTDSDGKIIIDGLYLGSYCLIDQDLKKNECFLLESTSIEDTLIEKDFEFTKLLDKGEILLVNNDILGYGISGSIFEVINSDGTIIYVGSTNEEGIIKVSNLLYGDYCIKQKSVSKSYLLNDDNKCVLINENKEVSFVNEFRNDKVIMVPNTFSDISNIKDLRKLFIIIGLGVGVFIYKKVFC